MRDSFERAIGREERRQVLRFLAALIVFICALHVMCIHDAQVALARAQLPHRQQVGRMIVPDARHQPGIRI
jgi:hypothetical protein